MLLKTHQYTHINTHPNTLIRLFASYLVLALSVTLSADFAHSENVKSVAPAQASKNSIMQHEVKNIEGDLVKLKRYQGEVLLVVNTASRCGYTSQYKDLVRAQTKYQERGFKVLAFPCNDFGGQEPGSAAEIKSFCDSNFEINFPLFDKLHARGPNKSPLYQSLTGLPAPLGGEIRWNFTKFLVNRAGEVIARFESHVSPSSPEISKAIERALAAKKP